MGQHDFRQVDAFPLPAKLQQRQQPFVENRPLFDRRVPVVENLRVEGVAPDKRPQIRLEQDQRIEVGLGRLGRRRIVRRLRRFQRLLSGLLGLHDTVLHRGDGGQQVALLGVRVQLRIGPHGPPRSRRNARRRPASRAG